MMSFPSPRQIWFILGLACIGLVTVSLVLTVTLNLHACHLCIFQRLLFMLLAVLSLAAAFPATNRAGDWTGVLSLPTATLGVGVAAYQSWLQRQPTNSFSCVASEPGLIGRLVEWLGERISAFFLATGSCEDQELVILGLSLANGALIAYTAFLVAGFWALLTARRQSQGNLKAYP